MTSDRMTEGPPPERIRVGLYFTPHEFEEAKAAYLADWTNGAREDTLAGWVTAAISRHTARTPADRSRLAGNEQHEPRGRRITRTFVVPVDVVTAMRAALAQDRRQGQWKSVSSWCRDAIATAVDHARSAAGGQLPTPPTRLPNRLRR